MDDATRARIQQIRDNWTPKRTGITTLCFIDVEWLCDQLEAALVAGTFVDGVEAAIDAVNRIGYSTMPHDPGTSWAYRVYRDNGRADMKLDAIAALRALQPPKPPAMEPQPEPLTGLLGPGTAGGVYPDDTPSEPAASNSLDFYPATLPYINEGFEMTIKNEPTSGSGERGNMQVALSNDHPLKVAFDKWSETDEFKNALHWCYRTKYADGRAIDPIQIEQHAKGSMWLAFTRSYLDLVSERAVKTIATDAWSNWRTTKCRECGEYQTHGRRLCQKCGKGALTHLADHLSANEVGPWEVEDAMSEQRTSDNPYIKQIASSQAELTRVKAELAASLNNLMTRNNELLEARVRIAKLEAELATARATADSRLTELRQYLEQRNELVAERDAALAEQKRAERDYEDCRTALVEWRSDFATLRQRQYEMEQELAAANQRADDAVAAANDMATAALSQRIRCHGSRCGCLWCEEVKRADSVVAAIRKPKEGGDAI